MAVNDRIRWDQLRRRSGAAGYHRQSTDDEQWLLDYEAEVDFIESGELYDRRTG